MERLTSVGARRSGWILHGVLLVVLLAGRELVPNRFELFNAELLAIYLVGALALNLILMSGILSIGHSALFLLGGYAVAILTVEHGWSYWPALAVGGLLSAVVGLAMGAPALRLGVYTLALVTYGYARVAETLALEWRGLTGGFNGLAGVTFPAGFSTLEDFYWLTAVALVLTYALAHNMIRSPFGRAARAVAQQPVAAQAVGIDSARLRLASFGISSGIAGIAGGLYVPLLGFIAPDAFGPDLAILLLLMVVLGGMGTVAGPVVGAVVLFRLPIEVERLTEQPGEWSLLAYGVVLLLSVHFVPKGLMGGWFALRRRISGGLSRRRGTAPAAAARRRADVDAALPQVGSPGEVVVDVRGATKALGGVEVLNGIDFAVEAGTVHALIGPNGSGKTTFLNAVSGFVPLDRGHEEVLGVDVSGRRPAARARLGLGRTFQTPLVFSEMSCLENVLVALDMYREPRLGSYVLRLPGARRSERTSVELADHLLRSVGLEDRRDEPAGDLPPGQLRLLEIARVAALRPRAVLLDEPAAGLSGEEITELETIIGALRDHGIGVVLVEHHAAMVMRVSDMVTVIDNGAVIARGTPAEIQRNPLVLSAYLGTSLEGMTATERVARPDEEVAHP
ncbi:MAG: ATP-binding cassette domain-containing protein [Acidimicrobiia bacterium]